MTSFIEIRKMGDPVLKDVSRPIEDVEDTESLQKALFMSLAETKNALAVAAPQIGRGQRAFSHVLRGEPEFVANPSIVEWDGVETGEEGCLSIPGIVFFVERAKTILYAYYDSSGNLVEKEATGLEARMVQHEIDHLDGTLAIDRVDEDQRKQALAIWRERLGTAPNVANPPNYRLS